MRVDFPSLKAKQMTFRDAAHHMKQIFMQSFKTYLFSVVTIGAAGTSGSYPKGS